MKVTRDINLIGKRPFSSALLGSALFSLMSLFGASAQAQTLLSYWDFNNDSTAFASPFLGSFSTANAGYGEVYNASTESLSSNSANGVVFPLSSINFSGVVGTANGGNTSNSGFGIYKDVTQATLGAGQTSNLYAGDTSTQQGSLIVFEVSTPSTALTSNLVYSLDTKGYQGISVSFAGREGGTAAGVTWSYSYDDSTWVPLTPTQTGSFGANTFNDVTLGLGTAFDNKGAVYLEETITDPAGGVSGNTASLEMDNVQVLASGILAAPEPSSFGLGLMGIGLLAGVLYRRRLLGRRV